MGYGPKRARRRKTSSDTHKIPKYRAVVDMEIAIALGDVENGDVARVQAAKAYYVVLDGEPVPVTDLTTAEV